MQKELEITYIQDDDLARQNMLNDYQVGSWVLITTSMSTTLCVIAQTEASIITLIAIEEIDDKNRKLDANRMLAPFKLSGTHSKLSTTDINFLTKSGDWKIEKVNVQINVYTKEQE